MPGPPSGRQAFLPAQAFAAPGAMHPARRPPASRCAGLCASEIGSGINSFVSRVANPNIIP